MSFTPKQREVLQARVARGIVWAQAQQYERDNANALARKIVADVEEAGRTAHTIRRAVTNIADRLDETA